MRPGHFDREPGRPTPRLLFLSDRDDSNPRLCSVRTHHRACCVESDLEAEEAERCVAVFAPHLNLGVEPARVLKSSNGDVSSEVHVFAVSHPVVPVRHGGDGVALLGRAT